LDSQTVIRIMSVDLAWDQLQQSLADSLVSALNRTLASTTLPSFIGPAEITSFEFGTNAPEVEVVDVRDIHRDFLEDDSEHSDDEENPIYEDGQEEEEEYEWVSRRQAAREQTSLSVPQTPAFMHSQSFGARDFFGGAGVGGIGIHGLPRTLGSGGMVLAGVGGVGIGFSPLRRSGRRSPLDEEHEAEGEMPMKPPSEIHEDEPGPNPAPAPSLQMHLHVLFNSNLRLVVKTS
ncbi:Mitochondrial distribution and morphology protein 12, partial [Ceratobasidium sp. 392]